MVVGRGTKHTKLYITQAKIVKDVVQAFEFVDGTDFWHTRLCHISEKGMITLCRIDEGLNLVEKGKIYWVGSLFVRPKPIIFLCAHDMTNPI